MKKISGFSLIILSLIVSLILAEILFRIFSINDYLSYNPTWDHINRISHSHFQSNYLYDPEIGYIRKNISKEVPTTDFSLLKIMIVGDSISERGEYVNELSALLQRRYPTLDFKIFNLGTNGYGTRQEYLLARRYIDKIKPHLVILQFCMNDFSFTPLFIKTEKSWEAYNVSYFTHYLPIDIINRFEVLKLLSLTLAPFLSERGLQSPRTINLQKNIIIDNIMNLYHLTKEHGSEFLLFSLPFFLNEKWSRDLNDEFVKIVSDIPFDISFINMEQHFEVKDYERLRYSSDDFTHLSPYGAKIVASLLLDKISTLVFKYYQEEPSR